MESTAETNAVAIAKTYAAAVRQVPELAAPEQLAQRQQDGSLPAIETWLRKFNAIMGQHPRLGKYRRVLFRHLLTVHNAAAGEAVNA